MQAIAGGVLIVAGLILAQGMLALAEAALAGARKSRLKVWSARGDRGAEVAIRLGEDPRGFTPALQAAITFLGALAGVYGGVTLVPKLSRVMAQAGSLAPYRDAIGIVGVALLIALTTLVLAERIPHRAALHRPESIARLVSRPVRALAILTWPVVGPVAAATDRLLGFLGIGATTETPVSEESIQELMQVGTRAGVFEQAEHEMVKRVLRFGDRRARR